MDRVEGGLWGGGGRAPGLVKEEKKDTVPYSEGGEGKADRAEEDFDDER